MTTAIGGSVGGRQSAAVGHGLGPMEGRAALAPCECIAWGGGGGGRGGRRVVCCGQGICVIIIKSGQGRNASVWTSPLCGLAAPLRQLGASLPHLLPVVHGRGHVSHSPCIPLCCLVPGYCPACVLLPLCLIAPAIDEMMHMYGRRATSCHYGIPTTPVPGGSHAVMAQAPSRRGSKLRPGRVRARSGKASWRPGTFTCVLTANLVLC